MLPRFDALRSLRSLRARQAREQNVPAYVIFHDATQGALAANAPYDLAELGRISGSSVGKLEHYGAQVLETMHSG